jgi:hypothetical protein
MGASDSLSQSSAYLHDLVDLSRQVFQVTGDLYYTTIVKAYLEKDIATFQ